MLPHDFVDWNILPDDKRIFKVRNLMKARKKLERGEMEDAYRSLIENKTRDFLESKPDNFFFFSNAEVVQTKEEFPDCKQTEYKEYNDYISNLKWLSENTTFSKNVNNTARRLLQDLCSPDFEPSPTQVNWVLSFGLDDNRIDKVRNLMEARDNIQRGKIYDIETIEKQVENLEILPANKQFYFFSKAEVDKTKNEFQDCKQVKYKEYNDYISNLKWLSENTLNFNKKVNNTARRLLQDLCPQYFESAPTQVEWKDLPDDNRIKKVRNLMEARESYERDEIDADGITVIENEAINLESIPVNKQLYFFSNAEVKQTKEEFRDCKQIEYKEYNDYISNLKLLSENTLVSLKVRNKAYSLLNDLCPGGFEFLPTQVEWTYLTNDYRRHKVRKLMEARDSLERGEESFHKDLIEDEANNSRYSLSVYFFSNEEVVKTKKEFPDCKQITYERYKDYISNLKWLSENTQFSDKVHNKARSLLQDLCPRDFEYFPVATVVQDETPVALSINDYQGAYADVVDAGEATVYNPTVARRLGGRNRKSKRRKLSGRKLSGRKLSGRKLSGRKLSGRKLTQRK